MRNYIIFSTPEGAHLGYNSLIGIGSVFFPECSSKYFFFCPCLAFECTHTQEHQSYIHSQQIHATYTHVYMCVYNQDTGCSVLYAFCFDLVI